MLRCKIKTWQTTEDRKYISRRHFPCGLYARSSYRSNGGSSLFRAAPTCWKKMTSNAVLPLAILLPTLQSDARVTSCWWCHRPHLLPFCMHIITGASWQELSLTQVSKSYAYFPITLPRLRNSDSSVAVTGTLLPSHSHRHYKFYCKRTVHSLAYRHALIVGP